MDTTSIQQIGQIHFGETPQDISRMKIGICNEVYELSYAAENYILRMNEQKSLIYGTHRHLPIFKQLHIKTPTILAEDYSQERFPFCYHILTKIEGKDMGLVINQLSHSQLTQIAKEISNILSKFNGLPSTFWIEKFDFEKTNNSSLLDEFNKRREDIILRNKTSNVINSEILAIHDRLLEEYQNYFLNVDQKPYYDDLNFKNVMIHEGKFNGLVDLDFLVLGDYIQAIGTMLACWYGEEKGEFYIEEIIKLQELDEFQQRLVKVYAVLNMILWLSETGAKFNANSKTEIDWSRVNENRNKVVSLYNSIYT